MNLENILADDDGDGYKDEDCGPGDDGGIQPGLRFLFTVKPIEICLKNLVHHLVS